MEPEEMVVVVLCTFPNGETARQIGTLLVEKQLAACVNLVANVESIYRWNETVERSHEVAAWFKTTQQCYPRLEAEIRALHPYETPEILAIPTWAGDPRFVQWVADSTRKS